MEEVPPEGYYALIGNYYIGKTIGQGTFGKVKLGYHVLTNQNVAIKILEKDKILDNADQIRVQREILILRKIRHPNLIQLYEIIESNDQIFLITEYASNSELFNYIVKRSRLNERQSARFLLQIVNAVEYLHQNNIVHRDLKPENLLLDYNDAIKVVDFGLSNSYEEGQTLKTACGSPCYAAPEMVSGKRYNGLQTDLWSSGIILYAMLCGFLPFEDQNTSELYKKIVSSPLKLPDHLSENSKNILNGMLEKNPENRLTIPEIRKHLFCVLNSNQPILKGVKVDKKEILVDPMILSMLTEYFQIKTEEAKLQVQNNKHNQVTATYYLLLSAHIRNGGVSVADLSRPQATQKQAAPSTNQIVPAAPEQKDTSSQQEEKEQKQEEQQQQQQQKLPDQSPSKQAQPKRNESPSSSPMKKIRELLIEEKPPQKQKNESRGHITEEDETLEANESLEKKQQEEKNQEYLEQIINSQKTTQKQNFFPFERSEPIHPEINSKSEQDQKKCPPLQLNVQNQDMTEKVQKQKREINVKVDSNTIRSKQKFIEKIENQTTCTSSTIGGSTASQVSIEREKNGSQTKKFKNKKEFIGDSPNGSDVYSFPLSSRETFKLHDQLDQKNEEHKENTPNLGNQSPIKYKLPSNKIGKLVIVQQQQEQQQQQQQPSLPSQSIKNSNEYNSEQNLSLQKQKATKKVISNLHNQSQITSMHQTSGSNTCASTSNQSFINHYNLNANNNSKNVSLVAAAPNFEEVGKADPSPKIYSNQSSLQLKNYLIKSSISGLKNTFNKNFTGIISNISRNGYRMSESKQQVESLSSQHKRSDPDSINSYFSIGQSFKMDHSAKGGNQIQRKVNLQEGELEMMSTDEQRNPNKSGSRQTSKIHHKNTKSESSSNNNKKNISSHKENIEEEKYSYHKDVTPTHYDRSNSDRISSLLRQPLKKGTFTLALKESSTTSKRSQIPLNISEIEEQQQFGFFKNQFSSKSQHYPLGTPSNQGDQASVRKNIKHLSNRMQGSIPSQFKFRVRKSATPESHLITNNISLSQNQSQTQRRSNSNLQCPTTTSAITHHHESPPFSSQLIDSSNSGRTSSSSNNCGLLSLGRGAAKSSISSHIPDGVEQEYNLKQSHQSQEPPKTRTQNEYQSQRKEKTIPQNSGGGQYYLGFKQSILLKEQAPPNEQNQMNLSSSHFQNSSSSSFYKQQQKQSQQGNNNSQNTVGGNNNSNHAYNSTSKEDQLMKQSTKKTQNQMNQNTYKINAPQVAQSNSNKSAYFNSSTITSAIQNRFQNQQQMSDLTPNYQQNTNHTLIENSKSDSLKVKIPASAILPNSYSLANVTKYKIRKYSKIHQQSDPSTAANSNTISSNVNQVYGQSSIKEKYI